MDGQRVRPGQKRSNIYELIQRMWEFGQGKPRLGGHSVEKTEELRTAVMQNGARRHGGKATRDKGRS